MHFLAISGSARLASTNTALLRALRTAAGSAHVVTVHGRIGDLPVFSPDLEHPRLPEPVAGFVRAIEAADGLIVASPEYVRSIPGGLKNAIDWLVSRDTLIGKPVALVHASRRGDDMLQQLRLVLGTVSDRFNEDLFLRFDLMKLSPDDIGRHLSQDRHRTAIRDFLDAFAARCAPA
ncbi:MAG TPA: NADPH-dependent FMN reductase [Acidiphilium sp.]